MLIMFLLFVSFFFFFICEARVVNLDNCYNVRVDGVNLICLCNNIIGTIAPYGVSIAASITGCRIVMIETETLSPSVNLIRQYEEIDYFQNVESRCREQNNGTTEVVINFDQSLYEDPNYGIALDEFLEENLEDISLTSYSSSIFDNVLTSSPMNFSF